MLPSDEKTKKSILADFKSLRCMNHLSIETQDLLAGVSVKRKFHANEWLWEAGDPGEFFGIIVSGLTEISRYSKGEDLTIMGIFGPSDVIGLSAVMKRTPYPGSAKILTPGTEVIKVYLRPLLQQKSPEAFELHTWTREMFLQHEQTLRDKIDILHAGGVEYKVFELIQHLIRRFGQPQSPSKYFIPIQISRTQVGKLINVRVETVIRLLSRWQKEKLIHWSKDGILVDNLTLLEKALKKGKKAK